MYTEAGNESDDVDIFSDDSEFESAGGSGSKRNRNKRGVNKGKKRKLNVIVP